MAEEEFEIRIPGDSGEAIVHGFEIVREFGTMLGELLPQVMLVLEQYGQMLAEMNADLTAMRARLEDIYNEQKLQSQKLEDIYQRQDDHSQKFDIMINLLTQIEQNTQPPA